MRDLFTKDWAWKLFSLLLAVVIWFTVHRTLGESNTPATPAEVSTLAYRNLPVALVSAGPDVHQYRLLQTTVAVTVSGSPEIIGILQANQVHATVDLSDTNLINSQKLRVEVSVPPGVTVVSIKPASIGVLPPP
jgi:YbbR domain-containing protein